MSELSLAPGMDTEVLTNKAVDWMAKLWFVIAALGHWIFLVYLLVVFFPPLALEGLRGLDGLHIPSGFREGETLGNLAMASHVLLATIVIGGGPLQLISALRQRLPRFHRWLGRFYLTAVLITSIGGFYLSWFRSPVGDAISKLGTSGDALLIIIFSGFTLRNALARRLPEHRRWAMRLFMVSSAVWFFRVILMGWVMLTGGIGIDFESFTGPFIYTLGFIQYLLPLLMLEWYFYCQGHNASSRLKLAFTCSLGLLTLFMAFGIFAATLGLWLPEM